MHIIIQRTMAAPDADTEMQGRDKKRLHAPNGGGDLWLMIRQRGMTVLISSTIFASVRLSTTYLSSRIDSAISP